MPHFHTIVLIVVLIVAAGCARGEHRGTVSAGQPLAGTYTGLLPCADCPGIRTRAIFHADGSVVIISRYEDRGDAEFTDRGTWRAANGLVTATFGTERRYYKMLNGSELAAVDAEGRESSSMPDAYVLRREK